MDHRISTFVLLGIVGLIVLVVLVEGIDGMGTKNYLAKFTLGGVIGNSSLVDDLPNGSIIPLSSLCTATNGLCNSTGGTNITTYVNITNNITTYVNNTITNNITVNESRYVLNFTVSDVGSMVTHTLCLANDTCFSTAFTDSEGSYDDSWIQPALNLKANLTQLINYALLTTAQDINNTLKSEIDIKANISQLSSYALLTTLQDVNSTCNANISTIFGRESSDNSTQAGLINAKALPGTCTGASVVQNTTTSGVQCYTPTDTTYTATNPWIALTGTAFSWNTTLGYSTFTNQTYATATYATITNLGLTNTNATSALTNAAQANSTATTANTTATNALPKAGGTMTGNLAITGYNITGINTLSDNGGTAGINVIDNITISSPGTCLKLTGGMLCSNTTNVWMVNN